MNAAGPIGAAALDPAGGRIVGFAERRGGAQRVDLRLDQKTVRSVLATASTSVIPQSIINRLGAPPSDICAFEVRLPMAAKGARLRVDAGARTLLDVEWRNAAELARYKEGSLMSDSVTLEALKLTAGVFKGRVKDHSRDSIAPRVRLVVRGEDAGEAALTDQGEGVYALSAALPIEHLGEGVLTVEFQLDDGSMIGAYPLAAGAALSGDIAAEVGALRVELDLLKRAFRDTFATGVIRRDERPMIVADALAQVDHLLEMRDRMDRRQEALAVDDIETDDDQNWDVDQ